jgi:hypothetical protein
MVRTLEGDLRCLRGSLIVFQQVKRYPRGDPSFDLRTLKTTSL